MSSQSPFSFTFESTSGNTDRLDSFLAERTQKSRSYIQEQIKLGTIQLNQKPALKASQRLREGDQISGSFSANTVPSRLTPVAGNLEILYEDSDFLAINKAAGVIVHPGAGVREATLVHFLLDYFQTSLQNSEFYSMVDPENERPGIVHRLDVGTSGVILVAKNRETLESLSTAFKLRKIKKHYVAIAWGKMGMSGIFNSSIGRDLRNRQRMSSKTAKARTAITRWNAIERFEHFTYVELHPETGRTHQLRVHLSEAGHAIVGDPNYGRGVAKKSLLNESLRSQLALLDHTLLHAQRLEFSHPKTAVPIQISAPLPPDFLHLLQLIRECDPCPTK